jgi:hypothetical protein
VLVDLIVVVAGILIALIVDAAWEQRTLRSQERQVLAALEVDFERSLGTLHDWIALHDATFTATEALLWLLQTGTEPSSAGLPTYEDYIDDYLVPMTLPSSDLGPRSVSVPDSVLGRVLVTPSYEASLASLESLLASGQLNLIHSPRLRAGLAAFPAQLRDARDEELQARQQLTSHLRPLLSASTSLIRAELVGADWIIGERDEMPDHILETSRPVETSSVLVNAIAARATLAFNAYAALRQLEVRMREIRGWIAEELG